MKYLLIPLLFIGCTSTRELQLKSDNQALTLAAVKLLVEKKTIIDSLKTELENCKNARLLKAKL